MSERDDNKTMPWTDDELIGFGRYKLAYHFANGNILPLLPGGVVITYRELYSYGCDVKLPKHIRKSHIGGRSKF